MATNSLDSYITLNKKGEIRVKEAEGIRIVGLNQLQVEISEQWHA